VVKIAKEEHVKGEGLPFGGENAILSMKFVNLTSGCRVLSGGCRVSTDSKARKTEKEIITWKKSKKS
jgi:hypothetical protein